MGLNGQVCLRIFEDPCMLVVLPVGAGSLTGLTKRGPILSADHLARRPQNQPTAKKESVDA